jgi:hypothetical protein
MRGFATVTELTKPYKTGITRGYVSFVTLAQAHFLIFFEHTHQSTNERIIMRINVSREAHDRLKRHASIRDQTTSELMDDIIARFDFSLLLMKPPVKTEKEKV